MPWKLIQNWQGKPYVIFSTLHIGEGWGLLVKTQKYYQTHIVETLPWACSTQTPPFHWPPADCQQCSGVGQTVVTATLCIKINPKNNFFWKFFIGKFEDDTNFFLILLEYILPKILEKFTNFKLNFNYFFWNRRKNKNLFDQSDHQSAKSGLPHYLKLFLSREQVAIVHVELRATNRTPIDRFVALMMMLESLKNRVFA